MALSNQFKPLRFDYSALRWVRAGVDYESALPEAIAELGARRVLLVSNASLGRLTGQFTDLRERLGGSCVGLVDSIRAHTPRQDVLQALALARQQQVDLLVAIGGGSVIDACKLLQFCLEREIDTETQLLDWASRADGSRGRAAGQPASRPGCVRQIAVPTTLSGAEFSDNAGVLDTENEAKEGYRGPGLCPLGIIYDPALATLTPDWLWLSTAIRSLDHAIEGYCSRDSMSFSDAQFLHAMQLLAQSLPLTRADPGDMAARHRSQQGVWLAGCGLGRIAHGASHGIGYILGSLCSVPHGYTSCVMLPAVLRWNQPEQATQQAQIAAALGQPEQSAADAVRNLVSGLGLPGTLTELGIESEQLDSIAARAIAHPVVRNNPRSLTEAAQVREILDLAWA